MGGKWYRVMVTRVANNSKVAVKYIDFGYQSVTDKSKPRTLYPRLRRWPRVRIEKQADSCVISRFSIRPQTTRV